MSYQFILTPLQYARLHLFIEDDMHAIVDVLTDVHYRLDTREAGAICCQALIDIAELEADLTWPGEPLAALNARADQALAAATDALAPTMNFMELVELVHAAFLVPLYEAGLIAHAIRSGQRPLLLPSELS